MAGSSGGGGDIGSALGKALLDTGNGSPTKDQPYNPAAGFAGGGSSSSGMNMGSGQGNKGGATSSPTGTKAFTNTQFNDDGSVASESPVNGGSSPQASDILKMIMSKVL